jgi:hypothetical protein
MLPFTREQFVGVFVDYNTAIWPAQWVAYLLGLIAVVALMRGSPPANRVIALVLATMWTWTGVAYHGLFFARINPLAVVFGGLFVVQGMLFISAGVAARRLVFARSAGLASVLGWMLIAYAAVLYPLLGQATGHAYPAQPMFGTTPCPVTLFTFGVLLLTSDPVPRWLLIIPLAWSLVGGSAAFLLGVPQDWPLLFSGFAVLLLIVQDRQRSGNAAA